MFVTRSLRYYVIINLDILLILFINFRVTDLIVAAPFYFDKAEGGAVYIYTTLDTCRTIKDNDKCSPIKLVGHEESRFVTFLCHILLG